MGLAGIFEHRDIVGFADGEDLIHVGGRAAEVAGQDGASAWSHGGFDLVGIDLKGFAIGVDKDGEGVLQHSDVDGGDKRIRRNDHLGAGTDIKTVQDGKERGGSAGCRQAVFGPGLCSPLLLKFAGMVAVQTAPFAGVDHFGELVTLQIAVNRPGWKWIATYRLTTE